LSYFALVPVPAVTFINTHTAPRRQRTHTRRSLSAPAGIARHRVIIARAGADQPAALGCHATSSKIRSGAVFPQENKILRSPKRGTHEQDGRHMNPCSTSAELAWVQSSWSHLKITRVSKARLFHLQHWLKITLLIFSTLTEKP